MAKTKVRAKLKNGIVQVKALVKHPMETGARKDKKTGEVIPAHYITEVSCTHNGTLVMQADWTGGISKNPYFSFNFAGGASGDKVAITWKDNKEETETVEAEIK
ncbi:thiosulfate oxidation carrier complex protein SoxZ [Candidatus Albibeggiatoa sp. nov. NOAA]|uniref:thiosulfate oxidation carrier complex protein SoxZ n=1 Tax=Candidatus Albibeggiatoa sp. nov. NOAA TaxID=3162724 RepID=UPI0033005D3A|nr:thiosulfate oxidation carrier complex protein SoxZ [Thiotrichaceae bacterium]